MNNKDHKQQILFIKDVEKMIGRTRFTLRRWWSAEKFPKPVKLNNSVLSWHHSVIEQWISENVSINP